MKKQKILIFSIVLAIFIGLVVVSVYFYWRYTEELKKNPTREISQLTKEISKLMLLPESPLPTLATVTEKEKLQGQEFFKKAENGDKVLIYMQEGKAILYRPSIKKIIDVAPIKPTENTESTNTPTLQTNESDSNKISEKLKIVLYNGTTTTGITSKAEALLKNIDLEFEVTDKQNARKNDYPETVVVIINQSFESHAQKIADALGAPIIQLPDGEAKPEGDILIIVGTDMAPTPEPEQESPSESQ